MSFVPEGVSSRKIKKGKIRFVLLPWDSDYLMSKQPADPRLNTQKSEDHQGVIIFTVRCDDQHHERADERTVAKVTVTKSQNHQNQCISSCWECECACLLFAHHGSRVRRNTHYKSESWSKGHSINEICWFLSLGNVNVYLVSWYRSQTNYQPTDRGENTPCPSSLFVYRSEDQTEQ